MSAPVCELRAVTKSYGGNLTLMRALRRVSFAVPVGEHTSLLGPSGSGKSTLLRLLAGLEAPDEGEVWMGGALVSAAGRIDLPPHRRGIAMVFQDLALWPNLSVLDNVLLGLSGARLPRIERIDRARQALALCSIEDLADRRPETLSGGQQQRVALARALALEPRLLLLDEPFSGLDLVVKARLIEEVHRLAEERGFTVLLVSHDPLEATPLCRAAVVLQAGEIEEAGPLAALLREPRSELLRAFRDQLGPSGGVR
ncbi:MAG TPA: ATP-binding cassette domain-containing protein [Thermoanaerobaculia bacterium]|nr:ATP-binding cassette domain-containing protein [Thermoanaerobaculia bacterium]